MTDCDSRKERSESFIVLLMRLYDVASGPQRSCRPSSLFANSRALPAAPRVTRFAKRLRRPPRIGAAVAAMERERAELDGYLTQRGFDRRRARHLVVMVNGLNGAPTNWAVLKQRLTASLERSSCTTVFYASQANRRLKTFGGVCSCAKRLSEELIALIGGYPNLEDISFLVHSLGGLISRYACGVHYDPVRRTVFGLKPRHYISIASPHLGCAIDGEAQVPMLGWSQAIPLMGPLLLRPLLMLVTPLVMTYIYRKTGQQLFLLDGQNVRDSSGLPLLCRMVKDLPDEGHFLSALRAFRSRTCYANVQQDALVGWANASLRRIEELPTRVASPLSSTVSLRMDALENAFWSEEPSTSSEAAEETLVRQKGRKEVLEFMLKRLQSLPWCRIDVRFHGTLLPMLAHTHIQVTRPWIDSAGLPVLSHIVETFAKLETLVDASHS